MFVATLLNGGPAVNYSAHLHSHYCVEHTQSKKLGQCRSLWQALSRPGLSSTSGSGLATVNAGLAITPSKSYFDHPEYFLMLR